MWSRVNTLKPRQNGRRFADYILIIFFQNKSCYILIPISLRFVPMCPTDNSLALVQKMAWRLTGAMSLSETIMA